MHSRPHEGGGGGGEGCMHGCPHGEGAVCTAVHIGGGGGCPSAP